MDEKKINEPMSSVKEEQREKAMTEDVELADELVDNVAGGLHSRGKSDPPSAGVML